MARGFSRLIRLRREVCMMEDLVSVVRWWTVAVGTFVVTLLIRSRCASTERQISSMLVIAHFDCILTSSSKSQKYLPTTALSSPERPNPMTLWMFPSGNHWEQHNLNKVCPLLIPGIESHIVSRPFKPSSPGDWLVFILALIHSSLVNFHCQYS